MELFTMNMHADTTYHICIVNYLNMIFCLFVCVCVRYVINATAYAALKVYEIG